MTGIRCYHCSSPADHKQGRQHLCDKHYRFIVMRATARRHGKIAPTLEQLHDLLPPGMVCPMCGVTMVWLGVDGPRKVISLRHFDNHQTKFVCRSCSVRATFAPDEFMMHDPLSEKHCPKCGRWKPLKEFYVSKRGFRGDCIACEKIRRDAFAVRKRNGATINPRRRRLKGDTDGE